MEVSKGVDAEVDRWFAGVVEGRPRQFALSNLVSALRSAVRAGPAFGDDPVVDDDASSVRASSAECAQHVEKISGERIRRRGHIASRHG